jgi:hypothetical protein
VTPVLDKVVGQAGQYIFIERGCGARCRWYRAEAQNFELPNKAVNVEAGADQQLALPGEDG